MRRQALLSFCFLLAGFAAPAYGQEVNLKLKFKEGEKFWVEEVTTNKYVVSLIGQQIKVEEKTTMILSYTTKKVTPKSVELAVKIEAVDVSGEGGLGGQSGKILEKTKGGTFTVILTPDGKLKKLEGFQDIAKRLTGDDDDIAKVLKEYVNEDIFTASLDQTFGFIPEKAVKKGDTWSGDSTFSLGPMGFFKLTNKYSYNGKGAVGEEISVKQSLQYTAPKGADLLGIKIVKGDFKGDKATETYAFDAEKGRLISATKSMRIGGTLTVAIGDQQVPVEMTLETSGSSQVHDKNPVKQQ